MLSKVLSLGKLSRPQIWNVEQEKDGEKEKVGGRPAKLNEKKGDRDLEREIKNRRKHENFVATVTKWEMLAATNARWKWAAVKRNEQAHVLRSFWKFHVLVAAKQQQRNVKKKSVLRVQSCFCWLDLLLFFVVFWRIEENYRRTISYLQGYSCPKLQLQGTE